ncbi:MAG TPA: biopolymer transporter ExbD [Pyrinomonadaceae bacterium]|nr:biopolymer transporter ExbD [Pyrinomonadaceae bacterium]
MGMTAGSGGLQSEINVTPMVDVMLVLLIIFMVVTPFLQKDVQLTLPRDMKYAEEDEAINAEKSVVISIPNDGEYYLSKKKMGLDELKGQVEKALANKKEDEKIVYIKSGVQVSYGEVVNVINAVREKGVDRIGLVADKKKKEGQAPAPAT